MRLRITAPEGKHFRPGWAAQVFLNDIEVSQWVNKVVVTTDANDGAIRADVSFYLTGLDVDVPALIAPFLTFAKDDLGLATMDHPIVVDNDKSR